MSEPQLLPGIREASETFWQHMQSLSPPVVLPDTYNHTHVSTSLLLALARFREVVAPGTMETAAKARADDAFDRYDHGDMLILEKSPWWINAQGEYQRIVSVQSMVTGDPRPVVFTVRFNPGNGDVHECFYDVSPS